MNQDQVEEALSTVWSDIHDVITSVKHLNITEEEVGEDLTVFVEGNLERINPLRYLGTCYHLQIKSWLNPINAIEIKSKKNNMNPFRLTNLNLFIFSGNVKGEDIIVEEKGDWITIRAPRRMILGNWLLKGMETMAETRMEMLDEVVILEHPTQRGSEKIPFSLTLFYTVV